MFKIIIEKLKIKYHLCRKCEDEKLKKKNSACYISYSPSHIFLDNICEYSKTLKKEPYGTKYGKYKVKTDITGQRCMKCSLRFKCPFPPDIRICSKYGLTEDKYFKEVKNGK